MSINIKIDNPFSAEGNWYRGNLHTHTTNSDGPLSPGKTVDYYRKRDYQFLCITDHKKVTEVVGLGGENFLVLRGAEYAGEIESGKGVHIVGIDIRKGIEWTQKMKGEKIISQLKNQGSKVIIAHPHGSNLPLPCLLNLKGYLGIEVFNAYFYFRDRERAYSTTYWDELLRREQRVFGFASDDGHGYDSKTYYKLSS